MRPIKFRQPLWDKHNKFVSWHYWGFIGDAFIEPEWEPASSFEEARKQSQQFIDLKDKVGAEIYDGDICRFMGGGIGEVFWNDMRAMFAIDPSRFDNTWNKRKMICPSDEWDLCEVIGNIFQNKEKENQ